tara:strand:- start:209 stop:358 length:150 start_codon:yes stop_codon:yes gene_type:complete
MVSHKELHDVVAQVNKSYTVLTDRIASLEAKVEALEASSILSKKSKEKH